MAAEELPSPLPQAASRAVGVTVLLSAALRTRVPSASGTRRYSAMSRHEPRQKLAREYGATDIVAERGDEGVARIKKLTGGYGAHSVIEAVGTQDSMMQAIRSTRAGGHVGFGGVAQGVELLSEELFFAEVHVLGGPAPVRRFLPELIQLIWDRKIAEGRSSESPTATPCSRLPAAGALGPGNC